MYVTNFYTRYPALGLAVMVAATLQDRDTKPINKRLVKCYREWSTRAQLTNKAKEKQP